MCDLCRTENAYYGLSGMYIVHDKSNEGGCGEPWNMDALPDLEMQLKDAVLDKQCQLYYDRKVRQPPRDGVTRCSASRTRPYSLSGTMQAVPTCPLPLFVCGAQPLLAVTSCSM